MEHWLRKIAVFSKNQFESSGKYSTEKKALEQYVQTIKTGKINDDSSTNISIKVNTGATIIVVGCKSDLIDIASIKHTKEFQGKLRSFCLQFGAALIYTSTSETKTNNTNKLRKYIFHRLYPEIITMELDIDVSSSFYLSFIYK